MSETDNQVAAEAPGSVLATARQAQNLSVADAARQLKLSVSQIEALEAGEFEKLPGAIFVRGFIRNYARLLKLDSNELLRTVDLTLPSPPAGEAVPPSKDIPFPTAQTARGPWYAIALVLLLGGLVAFEFFWSESETGVSKPLPLPAAAIREIKPSLPIVAPVSDQAKTEDEKPGISTASEPKTAGPNTTDKTAAEAPSASPVAAAEISREPRPEDRPLRLVFNQESWVEIRDRSGKIVISQLNPAGSEKRVYGTPPMSVVIGNAHGVQLIYNNQPIDLALHTKVDVARFTLE